MIPDGLRRCDLEVTTAEVQQDDHRWASNHKQCQRRQLKNDFEIDAAQETHISPRSRPGLCRFGNRFYRADANALSIVTKIHYQARARLEADLPSPDLSVMTQWQCVRQCGACCHLDPRDRPDLEQYLQPEEMALYLSMVGSDGWCIHFDHDSRLCSIYDDRPRFCRVQPETFESMFGVPKEDLNDFAIACCEEQIEGVYGDRSLEQIRFRQAVGLVLEDL